MKLKNILLIKFKKMAWQIFTALWILAVKTKNNTLQQILALNAIICLDRISSTSKFYFI